MNEWDVVFGDLTVDLEQNGDFNNNFSGTISAILCKCHIVNLPILFSFALSFDRHLKKGYYVFVR